MNVFVAGGSGVLGSSVVRLLVEQGHVVTGLTSRESKRGAIERLGARTAVADALDAGALRRVVAEAEPEAVLSLLTRLPRRGPMTVRDLKPNVVLFSKGTANVVAAAKAAGVGRLIAQSIIFRYGYGDLPGILTEETLPQARAPARFAQSSLDGLRDLEHMVLAVDGIVLRYGLFYGSAAGHMATMETMLRRRVPVIFSPERGALSWIHVDDAASATVAAFERGKPGEVYNVVDDEPVSFADFVREFASVIDAPSPRSIPRALMRPFMRYAALFSATSVRASNAKAKRELGWSARYPTITEGMKELARPAA